MIRHIMQEATHFTATIGVVAGFGHDNEIDGDPVSLVAALWYRAAKDYYDAQQVWVSAVLTPSLTVYNQEWGCPKGGEVTVTATGCNDPRWSTSDAYVLAVLAVVGEVRQELKQESVTVEFSTVKRAYLTDQFMQRAG